MAMESMESMESMELTQGPPVSTMAERSLSRQRVTQQRQNTLALHLHVVADFCIAVSSYKLI